MKNAFRLMATYFVYFTLYILFGTFLYSIFQNALNFTAGSEIVFFRFKVVLSSFFCIVYSACFFICPFVAVYRVRHVHGILQTVAYILICLITWGVIFPSTYFLEKKVGNYINSDEEENVFSSGFFRETDKKIWYFTKNFDFLTEGEYQGKNVSNVVIMDKSEDGNVTFEIAENSENSELVQQSKPFKEIGIKKALDFTKVFSFFNINLLVEFAKNALENGCRQYLQFLSIAFLLCSLYGISYFFDWRLLNVYAILSAAIIIVSFNIAFYFPFMKNFREYMNGMKFFDFLDNYIKEPFIFILNIMFGIVFSVIGCVKSMMHHLKEKQKN